MNHKRLDIHLMLALMLVLLMVLVGAAHAQMPRPESCQEASDWGETMDGEYLLNVNGRYFTVYCYDMAGTPKEYLTLVNSGASFNFAQYTIGGAITGTTVKTNYEKVRINPQTLQVDIGDQTFATSTGLLIQGSDTVTSMPYGVAMGCDRYMDNGLANIDLRGTPFAVNDTFILGGYEPAGTDTFSADDQVVDVTGGGYCGWNQPEPFVFNPINDNGDFQLDLTFVDDVDSERAALMSLYESTEGSFWLESAGWGGTESYCTWYGVICDSSKYVLSLDLASNNLYGPIPTEINGLVALQMLNLSGNSLIEPLPVQLGYLPQLQLLDLSDNEICGKSCGRSLGGGIPRSLSMLSNLQTLDLSGNVLEGAIPAQLGKLSNLQTFDLSDNYVCTTDYYPPYDEFCRGGLFGTIPARLSRLSALQSLSLHGNRSLCWETVAAKNWALTLPFYSGPTDCSYLPLLQDVSS